MKQTSTTTKIHPSDVVVWNEVPAREGGLVRFTLRRIGTAGTLVDRQDDHNKSGRFLAIIECHGDPFDVDGSNWMLCTQGFHSGGRRYRQRLTYAEAQAKALAWLDRRFAYRY